VARAPRWRALARRLDAGEHDREHRGSVRLGLALANLLHGIPLDGDGHFTGSVSDLISAYTLVGGLAAVALFALHGADVPHAAPRRRAALAGGRRRTRARPCRAR
jgi:cytochrome d ubiquinol oxidase subunit II